MRCVFFSIYKNLIILNKFKQFLLTIGVKLYIIQLNNLMRTDTKEKRQQKRHKNPLTEKIGGRSMSILSSKRFQKYFVPGIVFQSCVIAGGYGTGRELVEYFMGYGPKGGLLGMCIVSLLVWSLICAISFMFAQIFKKYDYVFF